MANIKMPGHENKREHIKQIVDLGTPRRQGMLSILADMLHQVGVYNLIADIWDSLLIATTTVAVLLGLLSMLIAHDYRYPFTMMLVFAPVMYFALSCATLIKERISNLYRLKMTLKYNLHQIIVFRMLVFSIIGAAFCACMCMVLFRGKEFDIAKTMLMALIAQTIFASLLIAGRNKLGSLKYTVAIGAIWVVVIQTLGSFIDWASLLEALSTAAVAGILVIAVATYMLGVRGILLNKTLYMESSFERNNLYADS